MIKKSRCRDEMLSRRRGGVGERERERERKKERKKKDGNFSYKKITPSPRAVAAAVRTSSFGRSKDPMRASTTLGFELRSTCRPSYAKDNKKKERKKEKRKRKLRKEHYDQQTKDVKITAVVKNEQTCMSGNHISRYPPTHFLSYTQTSPREAEANSLTLSVDEAEVMSRRKERRKESICIGKNIITSLHLSS